MVALDPTLGREQRGMRPYIVISDLETVFGVLAFPECSSTRLDDHKRYWIGASISQFVCMAGIHEGEVAGSSQGFSAPTAGEELSVTRVNLHNHNRGHGSV